MVQCRSLPDKPRQAAEVALRILDGEKAGDIKTVTR